MKQKSSVQTACNKCFLLLWICCSKL